MGTIQARQNGEELEELVTDLTMGFDRRYQTVKIEGLGAIRLRSLTAGELMEMQRHEENAVFAAICLTVCDGKGRTTHTIDDETFAALREMPSKSFDDLNGAITEFCLRGIEDVETTAKN